MILRVTPSANPHYLEPAIAAVNRDIVTSAGRSGIASQLGLQANTRAACGLALSLARMARSSAHPEPATPAPAKPLQLSAFLPQVPVFAAQRVTLRAEVSWTVAACSNAGGGKSGLHRAGCRLMAGRREARNRATETSVLSYGETR